MTLFSNLFGFFYEALFGCRHSKLTRPFTIEAETYKVCLDCGKQIYYSTERMTPLSGRELRQLRATQASLISDVGVAVMPATAAEREAVARRSHKSNAA